MLNNFWTNPLSWIGIYLIGYVITIVILSLPEGLSKIRNKIPKFLIRVFVFFTFIMPIIVLPFTKGSRIAIPMPAALIVGITLLGISFLIKILAQRQIGVSPVLKSKTKLVTKGLYKIVRHPLYMSQGPLAMGMAVLFRSTNALLFSIPYFFSYLLLIYFEEKNLLKEYGEEYLKYKKKVPYRLIPKII